MLMVINKICVKHLNKLIFTLASVSLIKHLIRNPLLFLRGTSLGQKVKVSHE